MKVMFDSGEDSSLEQDFKEKWKEALDSFSRATEGEQLNTGCQITPADLVVPFRSKEIDGIDRWTRLALRIGNLLQNIGKVTASIGFLLFPPSDIVMKAIDVLARAAIKYGQSLNALNHLFERIASALELFDVYVTHQDDLLPGIRKLAHEILLQLISTFQVAYAILKGNRFKLLAKAAIFDSHSGIQTELRILDGLTQKEALTHSVYTLVNTTKTVTMADQFLKHRQQIELDLEKDKDTQFLIQHLGRNNQDEEWRRHMDRKGIPFEPGCWIKDHKAFVTWTTATQGGTLLLRGGEATGKTILTSRIVEILQRMDQNPKGAHIAYFFAATGSFERDDFGSRPQSRSKPTLDTALRTMALQLSKSHDIYRKKLITNLRRHISEIGFLTTDSERLFELLFTKNIDSSPLYLLIDDLHGFSNLQVNMTLLNCIDKQPAKFKVNLLATIRKEEFDLFEKARGSSLDIMQIDLGLENKDIARYARHEVLNLSISQNDTFRELRARIQDTLSKRQSFKEVDLILSTIRDKQREKDIQQILEEFENEKGTHGAVVNLLQRCNDLDDDNIKDLTTLLQWTLCTVPFSLDVQILAEIIQFRNPPPAIKPLQKRMNEDFRDFFKIDKDSGVVTIATEAIKIFFEEFASNMVYSERHTQALVTAAETAIVQRILKNMCDESLYNKLGFDSFFKEKTKTTFKVHVNVKEMHAQVALDCMRGILSTDGLSIRSEMESAWYKILSKADPAQLNHDLKEDIGRVLIPILYDDRVIDSWQPWSQEGCKLVLEQKTTQVLLKLLEDTVVQEGAPESQHKGLIQQVSESSAEPCQKVWSNVVQRMACWWLLEAPLSEFSFFSTQYNVFRRIQGFLQQTSSNRPKSIDEDNWNHWDYPILEDIEEVIAWAKKASKMDRLPASSFCQIGDMYFCFARYSQALDQYCMAETLDAELYQATSGKAYVEWQEGYKEQAILTMQLAIKKQTEQRSCSQGSICALQQTLAGWHAILENYQEALEVYGTILEIQPYDYATISNVLDIHRKIGNKQATRCFLDTLVSQPDDVYSDRMTGLLTHISQTCISERLVQSYKLFETAKQVGYLGLINKRLHEAIKVSKKYYEEQCKAKDKRNVVKATANLFYLYSIGARWLYRYYTSRNEQNEALIYGQNAVELCKNLPHSYNIDTDTIAIWLSQRYLSQAWELSSNSEEERQIIGKIKGFCFPRHILLTKERFQLRLHDVNNLLGFYHAKRGHISLARKYLKHEVEVGIGLLSNETKDDDWEGFLRLALAFMRCNDESNATAAFSLITPTSQAEVVYSTPELKPSSQTPSSPGLLTPTPNYTPLSTVPSRQDEGLCPSPEANLLSEVSSKLEHLEENRFSPTCFTRTEGVLRLSGPLTKICGGKCGHKFTYASDMYWCKNCPNVQFDKACLHKLKCGQLEGVICDPEHEFFYVPPWEAAKSKELGDDMVNVEGKVMTIEQWLADIKKTWGLGTEEIQQQNAEESEGKNDDGGVDVSTRRT